MSFIQKLKDMVVSNIAEIYEITYGQKTYYYTNLDYNFIFNGIEYESKTISRSNIMRNENVIAGEMTLTLPKNDEVSLIFRDNNMFSPVFIKLYGIVKGDVTNSKTLLYTGYINSSKTDVAVTEFNCNTNEQFATKQIIRYRYGPNCQNDVYDQKCLLNKENFKTTTKIINAINKKTTITIDSGHGKPDGYFKNGFIKKGNINSSTIIEHTGDTLTLFHPFSDVNIGDEIELFPGCNRTSDECKNKFNNYENYFGFDNVPNKNPMNGGII